MNVSTAVPARASSTGRRLQAAPVAARRQTSSPTSAGQREVILALLLILCYGMFRQVPLWNENTRYDLVVALVDDRTTRIDPYHQNTGDKALYDGHYYTDKPPGSSLLGVPTYALIRATSALAGADRPEHQLVVHALAFTVSAIPTVLLALLLLRFLRAHVSEWWALTVTVAYALGTLAFPFATMYFGHAATTFFLFAAFYVIWRTSRGRDGWTPLWAGFLAGWAILVDYAALLGMVVLLVYAMLANRRAPFLMVAGALPPALALLAYNWVSFGGPFSTGYTNLASPGFAERMSEGILGVTWPKLEVLNEILLGPRGLLFLSPWLAVAPLGLWAVNWPYPRRQVALCGAMCLAYLTFNAGYHLPIGGASPGPRFLLPALPYAAVLVALAPRAIRPLTVMFIAVSLAIVLMATATMPNALEGVRDPLFDLWLPRFLSRDLADTTAWLSWGLAGAQPLAVLGFAAAVAVAAGYATTRPVPTARLLAGVGTGLLVVLVLCFGAPLDLPGKVRLAATGGHGGVDITILDAGATVLRVEEKRPVTIWAQLENHGDAVDRTMVAFSVHAPDGERTFSAWHGEVSWKARERKRLGVEWSAAGAPPGEYRFRVTVTDAEPGLPPERQHHFADFESAGSLRIR